MDKDDDSYDMIWYGMVWYGMVYDMVWYKKAPQGSRGFLVTSFYTASFRACSNHSCPILFKCSYMLMPIMS